MFTLAGILGVAVTLAALWSRSYRRLSAEAATPPVGDPQDVLAGAAGD